MTNPSAGEVPKGGIRKWAIEQQASPYNLPAQLTSFVGRQRDVEALKQLLQTARLLTLTGPGGSGKTRLALEVASQCSGNYENGVVLVRLAPLDDPGLIADRIAQAFAVEEQTAEPLWTTLQRHLARQNLLLLLDNFEHLLAGAPPLAGLLANAPRLFILTTSREPLHLYGEHEYPVAPLAIPAMEEARPEVLMKAPAVQLFAERLRTMQPSSQLDEQATVAVADICRLLDGLPLAIELAAARSRLFGPAALLARLQKKGSSSSAPTLSVLTGGERDRPARQKTVRATIDWSYHLLLPAEQALFRRMAIFAGGSTLEAIGAVCLTGDLAGVESGEIVSDLVEKSLLFVESRTDGEPRFGMLHVVREYAGERLEKQREIQIVSERHAGYYLGLAEVAATKMKGPESTDWFNCLESEHDNLRAALRWTLKQHQIEMGLRALPGLAGFWIQRGHTSEGRQWAEQILSGSDQASPALRAAGLQALAILRHHRDESYAALQDCERALALYRQLGDRRGIANCLANMGAILRWLNEQGQAQARLEESLLISRELDDKALVGYALLELVAIALFQQEYARVASLSEELMSIARANEDSYLLSLSIYHQGISLTEQGEHKRGRKHLEKGLPIVRQIENPLLEAYFLTQIGLAALRAGDLAGATFQFRQALPKAVDLDLWIGTVAQCLDGLARVVAAQGQNKRAVKLWAGADYFRDSPEVLSLFQQKEREQAIHAVRTRMASEAYHQAWADGRRLAEENRDEFIAFALSQPEEPQTLSGHPFDLTPRQIEVLALVAQGLTDAEVAETLVISPRTVNNHLTVIYQKLEVNSRTTAVLVAQEHGLV